MSLVPEKRYLDDLVRDLFAPILAPGRPNAGWRLVSWDAEQGLSLILDRGGTFVLIELEERDASRDCYARTAKFNVCARRQFEANTSLSQADRRLVDAVVKVVRQREGRLPVIDRPTTSRRRAVREILVDRVLIPEGGGHYYINPYVGCMIGCEFCYVAPRADLSRSLEGLPRMPWGQYVDVKINAAEVLAREVRQHPPGIVRMSPILTDPYQSVERHYRITRQCLEVMLGTGFTPAVLTRAARVTEDLDLLQRFRDAFVGFSIPSDDDRYRQLIEPGADPIEARIEALRSCAEAGIHTVALIQPLLPCNVDRLVDQVAPLVKAVRIDRLYFVECVRHLYAAGNILHATTDAFFEDTGRRLTEAFRARGVMIDEMDDMVRLLGSFRNDRPSKASTT